MRRVRPPSRNGHRNFYPGSLCEEMNRFSISDVEMLGFARLRSPDGKVLMQFGGRGNAAAILVVVNGLNSIYRKNTRGFTNGFYLQVVDRYIRVHPLDDEGNVHVGMVRLEVEAEKKMKKIGGIRNDQFCYQQ
jgi:hypothetical protein